MGELSTQLQLESQEGPWGVELGRGGEHSNYYWGRLGSKQAGRYGESLRWFPSTGFSCFGDRRKDMLC